VWTYGLRLTLSVSANALWKIIYTQGKMYKSFSRSAQYVPLQKYFSHSSLVIYFFSCPAHKIETGTAKNRWRLLIVTQMHQSNYVANQQQVFGCTVPLSSLSKLCKNAGAKPFCAAKPACFDFSSFNFNFQATILSTDRVAPRSN
jgi:hypothetical protein